MKFSVRAIALSSAILWGLAMLFVGLVHMAAPSYGGDFLRVTSSLYPPTHTVSSLGGVLLGTVYGLIDGAIAGGIFGFLYSTFAHTTHERMK